MVNLVKIMEHHTAYKTLAQNTSNICCSWPPAATKIQLQALTGAARIWDFTFNGEQVLANDSCSCRQKITGIWKTDTIVYNLTAF